jgi:hypothetical protein
LAVHPGEYPAAPVAGSTEPAAKSTVSHWESSKPRVGPAGVIPDVELPRTVEGDDRLAQRDVVLSERLLMQAEAGNEQKYDL